MTTTTCSACGLPFNPATEGDGHGQHLRDGRRCNLPAPLSEGAVRKGGINRTYQIAERPADPPPIRRKLQIEWKCPECLAVTCHHVLDAMNGHASAVRRAHRLLAATAAHLDHYRHQHGDVLRRGWSTTDLCDEIRRIVVEEEE